MSTHAGRGEQSRQSGSSPPASTLCGLFERETTYYSGFRASYLPKTRITDTRSVNMCRLGAAQSEPQHRVLDSAAEAGVAA